MNYNLDKRKIIILLIIMILIGGLILFIKLDEKENTSSLVVLTTKQSTTNLKEFYVDVKGSVKKPGVYKFRENDRVIDAIETAGGLKKNANTNNINLSKKLESEMVIYVYNEKENDSNNMSCSNICNIEVIEVNNCIENNNITSKNEDLININTASLEELQTLSGIGESKAKNIIEYRSTNGQFKSIEELKNISGIGDSLFEKIKDNITV